MLSVLIPHPDLRLAHLRPTESSGRSAGIAKDLRLIVRERLVEGDTDDQVYDYVTDRYGDFVLLYPPLKPQTLVLWFGPLFLLLMGGWSMAR